MTDQLGHLLVPAVAAPGPRQPDHRRRPRRDGHARAPSVARRARRSPASRWPATAADRPTSTATSQLYGPGDIVGHRPARDRPHRAARLDHQLRAELSARTSSSTTRTSPGATRRPRPTRPRLRLRPWLALVVLARSEFDDGGNVARPAAALHRASPTRRRCPPADELWAWAHVHVNRSARRPATPSSSPTTWHAVLPRLQADRSTRTPTSPTRALVCPRQLAAEHGLPRVPGADVRDAAGWPGSASTRAGAPDATQLGLGGLRRPRRGPALPVLLPLVLPHRHRGRLRVPRAAARAAAGRHARRHARHRRAATRARTSPASPTRRSGGVLKLGGALRVPARGAARPSDDWAERPDVRELGPSRTRTRSRATLAALRQPGRRLRRASRRRRPTTPPAWPGVAGDPDPLITPPLYGRWHALTSGCSPHRDGNAASTPTDNWVHELNLDPRFRVAAGFGTRVVQDQPGGLHGRRLGADRRRARGQPPHPLRPARPEASAGLVRHASFMPLRRRATPSARSSLTAPVHRRASLGGATRPSRPPARPQPRPPTVLTSAADAPGGCGRAARLMRALPFDDARAPRQPARRASTPARSSAAPPKVAPPGVVDHRRGRRRAAARPTPRRWLVELLRRAPVAAVCGARAGAASSWSWRRARCWSAAASRSLIAGVVVAAAVLASGRCWRAGSKRIELAEADPSPRRADARTPSISCPRARTSSSPSRAPTAAPPTAGDRQRRGGALQGRALRDWRAAARGQRRRGRPRSRCPGRLDASRAVAGERGRRPRTPDVTIPRRDPGRHRSCPAASPASSTTTTSARSMAYPEIDLPMYEPLVDISSTSCSCPTST